MNIFRSSQNPIITPEDVKPSRGDFEIIGVFNAGVTRFEGDVILLLRVAERPINDNPEVALAAVYDAAEKKTLIKEFSKRDSEIDFSDPRLIQTVGGTYLTSISHLRLARSKDGIHFKIENIPAISPAAEYETFGIEDPRISLISGVYYIHYVAVSPLGVTTCLISTRDFDSFHRHGVIFCPENKDVALFPEKINDKFYALHRPVSPFFGKQEIWLAESPDLMTWGNHRHLFGPRTGKWDEAKVGAGAVPFRTERGWLEIYHGMDRNNRYCLGAVLLDINKPWNVLARSIEPAFKPETDYECRGFFGNVVFSCGLLCENDTLRIYYGAADTSICYAELTLEETLKSLNP
ncbi:MAG: glycoside hydrolase family 130 protein [Sedimentisphaerales bacterium]|nr:glycoside hydrolase family 130 protein [Sedimentisphaerales bacterium]